MAVVVESLVGGLPVLDAAAHDGVDHEVPPLSLISAAKGLLWTQFTVDATDFTAAAAAEDVELFVLPARGVIHNVALKHTTAFSGGTSSALTLSVGITGTLTKYSAAFDVFQATGDAVFSFNDLANLEDLAVTTSIRVEATATGDTLDNVGTGSCDIWVLTSELPV